jgi:hypothetical protein
MKKIFHKYPNFIIGSLAVIFGGILFAFCVWAMNDVVLQIRLALATPSTESTTGFDVTSASQLDLHGLVTTNAASDPAAVSSDTDVTTTTVTTTTSSLPSSTPIVP